MASKLVTQCTELGALGCLGYDVVFHSTPCQCVRKFSVLVVIPVILFFFNHL